MYRLIVVILLYLAIFIIFIIQTECAFFGQNDKIVVDVQFIKVCSAVDKEHSKIHLVLNFEKFNRTHSSFSMNSTVLEPFDHTYTLEAELLLWGDGGWKHNFMKFKRNDACRSTYLLLGPIWMVIVEAGHAKRECPIAKGFYWFDNMFLDLSHVPIIVQPGKFLFLVNITKSGYIATCMEGEVIIRKDYNF